MTTEKKRKLKAVGKIGLGSVRMASSVATAFGTGLLGKFLLVNTSPIVRKQVARFGFQGGLKMLREGWRELRA